MNGFFEYLLENKAVYTGVSADTWQDSIRKGGAFLVEEGVSTQDYIETMITKVENTGPYFILAPGIAMPHGRPEEGVLKTGYAVVILDSPVVFGDEDNDPIWMLIFMGAKDTKTHNEHAVSQIAELCDSEEVIEKIREAKSKDGILDIINEFHKEFEKMHSA